MAHKRKKVRYIMDKGKHKVDLDAKTVTFGHVTKTLDGELLLTTTFDLSKVTPERLYKRAADAELIAWRAKSGIKSLTTAEAEKFQNITVDCSIVTERVKHVVTEEEKALKAALDKLLSGGMSVKDLTLRIEEIKKMAAVSTEEAAQEELEAGESS